MLGVLIAGYVYEAGSPAANTRCPQHFIKHGCGAGAVGVVGRKPIGCDPTAKGH